MELDQERFRKMTEQLSRNAEVKVKFERPPDDNEQIALRKLVMFE
jgi:hypothetical protein